MKRRFLTMVLALWGCVDFDTLARDAKCDGGFGCEGTGGGSAAAGGGSADGGTGGGTATTGGGTATLGGGAATLGGGTATMGGGTATLGGGTATLGGGTATLGGGTATTGGGSATTGGGSATGGGSGTPACPMRDGGWSAVLGSDAGTGSPLTLPWGLAAVDCRVYVLLVNHPAANRDSAELVTFDSQGTRLSSMTLGASFNDTNDKGAHRLGVWGHTLVATYPTADGGGQLVLLDVSDGGPTEFKRAATPFMPQAIAVEPSANLAHLFGRAGTGQFVYVQGTLNTASPIIGSPSPTICSGVDVQRALLAPDGYLIFAGTHSGTGTCNVGSYSSGAGTGVFVAEIPPASQAITGLGVAGATFAEFSDISVAAGDTVWVTYDTASGASLSQLNRTGPANNFTLSLSNTTNSGNASTLPGDLAFTADGGIELAGTVSSDSSFVGVPITPDAGDYDAFVLRFAGGTATKVQTFGTPRTDGFTHVLPFGEQTLLLGISASYSSTDYMKAFLVSTPR